QRNGAQKLWLRGPHPVERADAVDQSLGIVQPVDADRKPLAIEAAPQPRHVRMRHRFRRRLREFLGVDADREYRKPGPAMMRLDDAIVNLQSKCGSDIGVEILAIFL